MAYVKRRKGESVEDLIKRFNRKVEREGIAKDMKRHQDIDSKRRNKRK